MATEDPQHGTDEETRARRWPFLLRRLHGLSGVVPVGVFLVAHLATNARALFGQDAFEATARATEATPHRIVLEGVLVLAPLAFHALYGVVIALGSRPNVGTYPTHRNWAYVAQRMTGFVALAFVLWHLGQYWLPHARGELAAVDLYPALCADLSSTVDGVPLQAFAYLLGVGAATFHFANGLWGASVSWGLVVSERAQRRAAVLCGVFGLALFALGANTAVYFATGTRVALLGEPPARTLARGSP